MNNLQILGHSEHMIMLCSEGRMTIAEIMGFNLDECGSGGDACVQFHYGSSGS